MPDEEFIAPDHNEPIPPPPPSGSTDSELGGVLVTDVEADIEALAHAFAAAVTGASTWAKAYALAKAQLAHVIRGRIRENVNPDTIWYYGTASIAAAWCFIFISWVLAKSAATQAAGLSLIGGKRAYVPYIRGISGYRAGHSGMKIGAIVAVAGFSHIGFCTYVSGSTFHLLSGNSTDGSSSDAITVKAYNVAVISGYVNLAYATTPTPTPTPSPAADSEELDEWVS
jgi:hypothetical protein